MKWLLFCGLILLSTESFSAPKCDIDTSNFPECPANGSTLLDETYPLTGIVVSSNAAGPEYQYAASQF